MTTRSIGLALAALLFISIQCGEVTPVTVHANQVLGPISHYTTGACIEDVNHEIYGGIYSQMLFGESFQEPAPPLPLKGFTTFGGHWLPLRGDLFATAGDGPKLIANLPAFSTGEASVELLLADAKPGNAGFIIKVSKPKIGADKFSGYEVALDGTSLILSRHRQNWEPIKTIKCATALNQWIKFAVKFSGKSMEIFVDGKSVLSYEDTEHPLESGQVGLRVWQRDARFRNLKVTAGEVTTALPFEPAGDVGPSGVSGMWRAYLRGPLNATLSLERENAFIGTQSQRVNFVDGNGAVGIENMGLNRWGLNLQAGKPYDGYLWARAPRDAEMFAVLQSDDGSKTYAEAKLNVRGDTWQRLDFALTPNTTDAHASFAIELRAPASVLLGHAFMQPGDWGRYKGLPCRRDIVEGLSPLPVLRYGGSMVNCAEYRWKKMIGPRDRRPPYKGTWYPYSSNGWGIIDFVTLCDAMKILGIPDFCLDETPKDMADFMEYVNGPPESVWGAKRVADGHAAPFGVNVIELGNEEAINDAYFEKFKRLSEAIWAKDANVILVVGDFVYSAAIDDPLNISGAASKIRTLAAHKKILELVRANNREVWFDIHIGTEHPNALKELTVVPTYVKALNTLCPDAKHKVVVFELNSNNHAQRRALANAWAISALETLGDAVPVICAANCLQPDKQNDNGWDQGLIFLNSSQTWMQPPYFAAHMIAKNYLPISIKTEFGVPAKELFISAKKSDDGTILQLHIINAKNEAVPMRFIFDGFIPTTPEAHITELAGDMNDTNSATDPEHIIPKERDLAHGFKDGVANVTFPAHSFSIIRFVGKSDAGK